MGLQASLEKLRSGVLQDTQVYRPSILSFLQLNVDKVAKQLKLAQRGSERGKQGEPPGNVKAFDEVENEVLEFIEGEVKKAHAALHDDLTTYNQRLHALDLEGRFSSIEAAAMDGISSFRGEVSRGLDELSLVGQRLREPTESLEVFKKRHGLQRAAHYPAFPRKVLQGGLIGVLFLLEVGGNTYFLAKGSAYGLIGGFAEAGIIAFLNIGVSTIVGHIGLRQCWHDATWRRAAGFASLVGWLAFATFFNLFVAHYREATGALLEGGGQVALQTLLANPIGLADFQSWVLFGIGALFAFIALVDAFAMDDPFPHYGALHRAVERAREDYADTRADLIAELEEIKTKTTEAMQQAKEDLGKRRGEHASILDARSRACHTYEQHLDYLERSGNTLLSVYRGANRKARKRKAPARFNEAWSLTRPPIDRGPPEGTMSQAKLEEAIAKAEASLDQRMREVHSEYEQAVRAYAGLGGQPRAYGG